MTKEQLIELVKYTAGEIIVPTELSTEDAESIVDDFVDIEQLNISVVSQRSELLAFIDWWNNLEDESDDRLYITDETVRRFKKANCG